MTNLGPSFRLVREENELSGKEVSKMTGINAASLTRFEQGKENLSTDKLNKLRKVYGLVEVSSEVDAYIKQCFENIFNYLFYLDRAYRKEFDKLKAIHNEVASSIYYPLFYIFDYCILIQDNATNVKITQENIVNKLDYLKKMIQNVELNIPESWLSLYHDYEGERFRYRYDYKKALTHYQKAEQLSHDEKHKGLIYYRMALNYTQGGLTSNALLPLERARQKFEKFINFERLLSVEFLNGTLYKNMRNYDEALVYFKRCLYITKKGVYQLSESYVYNNIIWMYMMKRDYRKVIIWCRDAIELEDFRKYGYLYLAWAYYELANYIEAEKCLAESGLSQYEFVDETDEKHFHLMKLIIRNENKSKINAYYKKIINSIQYTSIDTKLFIYQMMETYYTKLGVTEKIKEFKNLYLEELTKEQ